MEQRWKELSAFHLDCTYLSCSHHLPGLPSAVVTASLAGPGSMVEVRSSGALPDAVAAVGCPDCIEISDRSLHCALEDRTEGLRLLPSLAFEAWIAFGADSLAEHNCCSTASLTA